MPVMLHILGSTLYETAVVSAAEMRTSMIGLQEISNNSFKMVSFI